MTVKRISIIIFFFVKILLIDTTFSQNIITDNSKRRFQDSIIQNLKNKQRLARKINNKDSIIASDLQLTRYYTYNLPHNASTKEIFCLLEYCNDYNIDCVIESYFMLARQMQKNDQYLPALNYFNKSYELADTHKREPFKYYVYINQGTLLNELLEPDLARKKFRKSLKFINPDAHHAMASFYLNISSTFGEKNYDSLVYFSKKAMDILKENPDNLSSLEIAANNMAYGYIKQGKFKKASDIIEKYIDVNKVIDIHKESFESFFFNTVGELNYNLKKYDTAIHYYKKSIRQTQNEYPPSIIMSLNDLAEIYEIKGELNESIKYLKAKEKYLEKFNKNNLTKEIAKSEYNNILTEKNQLITNLEDKNNKTNKQVSNIKIVALSIGAFSLFIILLFLTIYQKSRLKISQLNEEISLVRLKSLKSMMNPHFLFNSFNTLQSFILQKDEFEASNYMRQLSQLIRRILFNSDSLFISFKEELEIIETYINIENKRFDDQFVLKKVIDTDLIKLNPKIPSMIIQPHIENAVIHGLSSKEKKELKLSFLKKENNVQCIIEDNGIGRAKSNELQKNSSKRTHLSIASINTSERIKLLKKVGYKKTFIKVRDLFDSDKSPNGTRITINLPIIN
ncbi:histidine kinase [Aquimarina sp. 2201CG5-10]|uniref:tetratricopeptide repeat-containing sensor histidine kinase n=1 Tax=Aquimarina callyspongiae TaxID=3098150 RepID=UPI002AB34D43|nr:histidine kinase [Aquimarina sp. 2201CG5-10]MDY8134300.1 histidine kinase [Aquimarina sp. 2201CG5-10]